MNGTESHAEVARDASGRKQGDLQDISGQLERTTARLDHVLERLAVITARVFGTELPSEPDTAMDIVATGGIIGVVKRHTEDQANKVGNIEDKITDLERLV